MNPIIRTGPNSRKIGLLVCFLVVLLPVSGLADQKKDVLSERHKQWLEEVSYIITNVEKEVFLKLESGREKDLFIETFWKQRDPTKGTLTNERKDEHYRRLNYSNKHFGRGTPIHGWRTDRGRIYILLGPPQDVQRYEGKTYVYPTEVWFYQGLSEYGLPSGFHILFFKRKGMGAYEIYSPLTDGPQALMTGYLGDQTDYFEALQQLRQVEPNLADVSFSLIPGEGSSVSGRPSMSSDILIQQVERSPEKMVRDSYARKFIDYKDRVDVEYSANYIDSGSLVRAFKDKAGIFMVHYVIEPENLSVDQFEEKYYSSLRLNGVVEDSEGRIIHQLEKKISLEFDPDQLQDIYLRPLCIRDVFPLIPGDYSISVLLMNETSKEFTSVEHSLSIPDKKDELQMTPLLLCYDVRKDREQEKKVKPFSLGGNRLYFHSGKMFVRSDELSVVFQVFKLNPGILERGKIAVEIQQDDVLVHVFHRNLREVEDPSVFIETVSLQDFTPGYYSLSVSVLLDEETLLHQEEIFSITHVEVIPRPWIFSKSLPPANDPVHAFLTGSQLFNSGRFQEARIMLEEAYARRPESIDYAVGLARSLFALEDFDSTEEILLPLIQDSQNTSFDILFMLARAQQKLGKFIQAVSILESMRLSFGVNIEVLNLLGICYFQQGDIDKALEIWEVSLEMKPDQPHLLESVKGIKEKR